MMRCIRGEKLFVNLINGKRQAIVVVVEGVQRLHLLTMRLYTYGFQSNLKVKVEVFFTLRGF